MRRYIIYLRDGQEVEVHADYFKQDSQTDETTFYCFGLDGKEDKFMGIFRYWIGLKDAGDI